MFALGVPRTMQKLMIKGLAKDSFTLREAGVTKGSKIMLVGSKLDDILSVSTPSKEVCPLYVHYVVNLLELILSIPN